MLPLGALLLPPAVLGPAQGVGVGADGGGIAADRCAFGRLLGGLDGPRIPGRAVFGLHHPLSGGFGIVDRRDPGRRLPGRGIVKDNGRVLPELLHVLKHFRGAGIPIPDFQSHGLENDLLQSGGDVGIQRGGPGGTAVDVLDGHRHRGFPVKGGPAGGHLVHDHPQGIQVGAIVRIAALGLLRGDIVHGAQGLLGQGVALGHDPGDAEVHDLHAAVLEHHHIVGLDVPVDDAPAVGVLQALGDLEGEMQGLLPVENPLDLHILLQGDAVDQLHHNIVGGIGGGDIKHLNDVGMAEHGDGLALRPEAAAEVLIAGILVLQDLDRHKTVQPVAECFVYNGHSAGSQHIQNLVTAIQQLSNILIHIMNNSFRDSG